MGDIGPVRRHIEVLPVTEPVLPVRTEPAPRPVPTPAAVPEPEPVKIPS